MFELPNGKPVNEAISLEEGVLQPFAHGVISSFSGRRKTPTATDLSVQGGWLATSATATRKA